MPRLIAALVVLTVTAGAFGVGAGDAHAILRNAESQSAPFECGPNTHHQNGRDGARCVQMTTGPIAWDPNSVTMIHEGRTAWRCPSEYPYVYGGSFSGNPWWLDRSIFPSWLVVRQIDEDWNLHSERAVSYADKGPHSPGAVVFWQGGLGYNERRADYMCTTAPWVP